jgi:histidinol-phosphatase (PHP family)
MTNYHTHTWRCMHATGDVPDYVEAARRAGLAELGFSDHVPQPDGRWPLYRMNYDELDGYIGLVREARRAEEERRARGAGAVAIRLGLECEYAEDLYSYYHDELLGERGLDYLAAGIHVYAFEGRWRDSFAIGDSARLAAYVRQVELAVESGLFAFLAHPDVFCNGYLPWDGSAEAAARDICAACESAGLPMEINANGLRKPLVAAPEGLRRPYPHPRFWEIASEYRVKAIAGSDAHDPADVAAGLSDCRRIAGHFGIELLESLALEPSVA